MEKNKVLGGVRKGAWTKQEDSLLRKCIEEYGEGKWHLVPLRAGLNRCRKSCRLRWLNYLRPDLKRGIFNTDEVDLVVRLHNLLGNRWSLIAGRIPGRTANDIKNFWNTHFDRKKKPPSPTAAGESSRRAAVQAITESNIIRPRPRTFSNRSCPSDQILLMTKTKGTNDNENPTMRKNPSDPLLLLREEKDADEVDECIRWWGNLLEIAKNDSNHDTNIDADIWEFLNIDDCQ